MNRLIVLAIPLLTLAIPGSAGSSSRAADPATGESENPWQASLAAEKRGRYEEARQQAAGYVRSGGDRFMAMIRTAWLYLQEGNHAQAEKFYTEAVRLKPGALSPRLGLLNVVKAGTDHAAIVKAAERVLAVEPTNYSALMAAAWARYSGGDHRAARESYLKVMELYPEDSEALSGAAWSAWNLGRKAEAKQGFLRLLALDPDYPHAQEGVGLCSR